MNFADRLTLKIKKNSSVIVAGIDPRLNMIPECINLAASKKTNSNEDLLYEILVSFYKETLFQIKDSISAVKPNIAFFEAFGLTGMKALYSICDVAKELELPIILDGKRGDIGSTAKAYSKAYLGESMFAGQKINTLSVDALTVNPFLGFDTLEDFINDCAEYGKGIFVLVKTSNPGSASIQDQKAEDGKSISQKVATWLGEQSEKLTGESGFSGLGAVLGATYPQEAKDLRSLMPNNYILIPGFGAQGASAEDAVAAFKLSNGTGAGIVNMSRGIFSSFDSLAITKEQMLEEVQNKVNQSNFLLNQALEKL